MRISASARAFLAVACSLLVVVWVMSAVATSAVAALIGTQATQTNTALEVHVTSNDYGTDNLYIPFDFPFPATDNYYQRHLTLDLSPTGDLPKNGPHMVPFTDFHLDFGYGPNGQISVGFDATSTDDPTGTTFTIVSSVLTLGPTTQARLSATGTATVTDYDGVGANMDGTFTPTKGLRAFEARWGTGTTWGGGNPPANIFDDLVEPVVVSTADTFNSATDTRSPAAGNTPIVGTLGSIQSVWSFTLSPDTGMSTTSGVVVPEPSSIILLASGAILLVVRAVRRKKRA